MLIDPKGVEFARYNKLPHLIAPVITEHEKAVRALIGIIRAMENRYRDMQELGFVNIDEYNASPLVKLAHPPLVIIIDELADLMMASKKDIEEPIVRLAQKARAAGIHLVIATQRPDKDVLTGLIKVNIPSRIAFAVPTAVNSRIILDRNGAEKLMGKGDMLYHPTESTEPIRVQGAYVSNDEINKVLNFIADNSSSSNKSRELMELIEGYVPL